MLRSFLLLGVIPALSLSASLAAAQPRALVLVGGTLECQGLTECPDADACPLGYSCSYVNDHIDPLCNLGLDGFFCCDQDSDCEFFGGMPGTADGTGECRIFEGDEQIEGVVGVCQFGDLSAIGTGEYAPTFCENGLGPDPETIIKNCMTAPGGGGPVENWYMGDCDDDGWTNGEDFALRCGTCDPANYPDETGMACIGDAVPDAGADAAPDGAVVDASADGSAADTGRFDAGSGVQFRGAGGCACDASSPPASDAPLLALAMLWLLFRTRRRGGRA